MKNLYPYFSQNPLDRLDQVRADKKEFDRLLDDSNSLFLILDGANIIVDEVNKKYLFSLDSFKNYNVNKEEIVLLGSFENIIYFALTLKDELKNGLSKTPLRESVNLDFIKEDKFGILAQGASVLNWHNSHQFCSSCGANTSLVKAGWRRDCDVCKTEHFPRVDSVVIMLVTFGEYCLLGRGVNFKEGRYSCLAGFVESGESLEEAAKRELFEEAGIEGYDVEYVASQPWPFPSTLMIGMRMKAKSQELNLDPHEIADAIWVHKDEIKAVLSNEKSSTFSVPDKIAIARNLLEVWIEEK